MNSASLSGCCLGLLCLAGSARSGEIDAAKLKRLFAEPPREYATAPLWVWNDRLTEDQIRDTLRDLAGQEVRQVFVHPRPGLMTPYLQEDWFRLWRVALEEAHVLDLNVWIYDENSYPSGFAGGLVPERLPEARGRGLHFREVDQLPAPSSEILGVYREQDGDYRRVPASEGAGATSASGAFLVAEVRRAGNSPWHGGRSYVDLLHPGVTDAFLDITLGAYQREIGAEFGRRVPGVFTDEPEIRPAGGLPWTDDLPERYRDRWGEDLHLPGLSRPVGDWKRVRHHYFQLLSELFIERWAKPYYERCEALGLEFTGHYWEHEWPNCIAVPDNMAMAAWQHRPGIDTLMNRYEEQTHAQFGNVRAVREIASVANQLGRRRTLCEIYGAGGWDLRFVDMKRIGDWLAVLGVNTFDEHLSYITLRGARKRDHPQSFSYHEPWWPDYHVLARYLTRLSAALSHGRLDHRVLVLEPTTTAWMYQGDPGLKPIGDRFFDLLLMLERAQIEYDLGCEEILTQHGSVSSPSPNDDAGAELRVGRASYQVVVLPPGTENLNRATVELIERFLRTGGRVLSAGPGPTRVEGRVNARVAELKRAPGWRDLEPPAILTHLAKEQASQGFHIDRAPNDLGILFHQRRRLADGELVFLVNTSLEASSRGAIQSRWRGAEQWDPFTGRIEPHPTSGTPQGSRVAFDLPPCGSLLLFLGDLTPEPERAVADSRIVTPAGEAQIRRAQPNVLTLDYVDAEAGGEKLARAYYYAANQWIFRQNGMARNPWDSAVQFGDEFLRMTFPADSGFVAHYRFVIEGEIPANLEAVVERPDLYRITCNGVPLSAAKERWWLDKAFGRIPLGEAVRSGENVLSLAAQPFRIEHELEPIYLRGEFGLRPAAEGFVIEPASRLTLGTWKAQGMPFYAEGVVCEQRFRLDGLSGEYTVTLPDWLGSVARVRVNGTLAGRILAPPWTCAVTPWLRPGDNTIEVEVVGTLKNTLGPFHGNPGRGSAWPGMFQQGPETGPPPGESYDTVGYGLLRPFELHER